MLVLDVMNIIGCFQCVIEHLSDDIGNFPYQENGKRFEGDFCDIVPALSETLQEWQFYFVETEEKVTLLDL